MIRELLTKKTETETAIKALMDTIRPRLEELEAQLNEANAKLNEASTALLDGKDKDTGTWNFQTDGVLVKAVISKTVKWDQTKLSAIWQKIAEAGDDPKTYINQELKVAENAYKAWPESIRSVFTPARTVIPGKPKFEYLIEECPF